MGDLGPCDRVHDLNVASYSLGDNPTRRITAVDHRPLYCFTLPEDRKVRQAALVASAHVEFRNVVAASGHACTNAREGDVCTWQLEVEQNHLVAALDEPSEEGRCPHPTQRRLEGERLTPCDMLLDSLQCQPTGLQQRATWFPSAYVAGDEIAIDESLAMRSLLTNRSGGIEAGSNALAADVLPAPFGPAKM